MKALRITLAVLSPVVLAFAAGAFPSAAAGAPVPGTHGHIMQLLAETTWGPAPPFVPPGAQIAVLSGNPMAAESYSVRLKFPAGYVIPPHSHPTDENVAVVSGELFMAAGDRLDLSAGRPLGIGGYALVPAGHNHYAFTQKETTIVLYGIGPVDFRYVNPADDPRNAKVASAK